MVPSQPSPVGRVGYNVRCEASLKLLLSRLTSYYSLAAPYYHSGAAFAFLAKMCRSADVHGAGSAYSFLQVGRVCLLSTACPPSP
jgi:hypothetical protein